MPSSIDTSYGSDSIDMLNSASATTTVGRYKIKRRRSNMATDPKITTNRLSVMRLTVIIGCSFCLLACLMPVRQVEAGRLQDFIQNLVGGRESSSNKENSSNNNNNANSNSNSNNDSSDSDSSSNNDSNDQQMTPMMSAMSPFMRYPSIYDGFGQAGFGGMSGMSGFPGMSFSNPMSAMSALSPMASMSSNSAFGGALAPPTAFSPASFGSFGSASTNPLSAFGGAANGMSASTLNNVYASSPSLLGGYTPYYGRRR